MKPLRWVFAVVAMLPSMPAIAACRIEKIAELPITMTGPRPIVAAKFGDKDARFILDSGAFYSILSRASAAEFGQRIEAAPSRLRTGGIGGAFSAGVVVARNFSLSGIPIPDANFIAGGSDTGTAGLIGQNILGIADVEYDLPHGAVRLMKTSGCARDGLAYWAGDKPATMVPLVGAGASLFKPHTVGTIVLNGVKLRAMFDSGAPTSHIALGAAKRAGVTPETPGVERARLSSGLGSKMVTSWLAPFDSIDIGGEVIRHPKIAIGDFDFHDADMVIGVDFFLTHRMFVSNATRAMFVTYEGGPLFGLTPKNVVSADGKPLDLTDQTADPKSAEDYSRRGAVFASNRRLAEALLDFDRACALAPTEPRYFYQRAMARLANHQRDAGLADLDRTIALAPADPDARLARAGLHLRDGDTAIARADVAAADQALAPSSDKRLRLAGLYDDLNAPEAALTNYDLWLKNHAEDAARGTAYNGRCWARGLLRRDFDKALSDCNAAVKLQPTNAAFLDSRALVQLRRGALAKALADYDAALAIAPRNAWTLYGRSIVEARSGDAAHAAADRAMALSLNPKVADRARKIGLEK